MKVKRRVASEALRTLQVGPATVRYPFEKVAVPEGFRGHITVESERCIGCSKCAIVCATFCITMVPDEREVQTAGGKTITRKRRPEVRLYDCIRCGLCEDACPTDPKAIYLSTKFAGSSGSREEVVK